MRGWDNLFTPKKLVDSSGTVVWDAALKPYGVEESILGSAVMNLRMPGQYIDEETGRGSGSSLTHPLYYNYNRDYDPATGRYTQIDPIGLAGGVNTFAYVEANPVKYYDAKGLASEHEKNVRSSTKQKHEDANARRQTQEGPTKNKQDYDKNNPKKKLVEGEDGKLKTQNQ